MEEHAALFAFSERLQHCTSSTDCYEAALNAVPGQRSGPCAFLPRRPNNKRAWSVETAGLIDPQIVIFSNSQAVRRYMEHNPSRLEVLSAGSKESLAEQIEVYQLRYWLRRRDAHEVR
ncbi:hypothetical protein ACVIWV_009218 [Bradyrhizobium diazoefficiens]|uniref:hypothetical protein n=1 Tax=Bradyrhizobium TaxID=374 RepID=UPI002012FB4D|nr:hypothetical protein [Bradyrhizobium diazoefficiens]